MSDEPRTPGDACLRCGAELHSLGETVLRTGGSGGAWKLIFGELAELGEGTMIQSSKSTGTPSSAVAGGNRTANALPCAAALNKATTAKTAYCAIHRTARIRSP